jgi:hypothetical protein
MKYCPECGSEYKDDAKRCADDDVELISPEEMHKRGLPLSGERDTRRFVRVSTAEDPLSAEQFVAALSQAQIPSFARPRRAGSVDGLTSAVAGPWWEIVAPEEQARKAQELIEAERKRIEASADEAGRAAEEEEAEMEAQAGKQPGS